MEASRSTKRLLAASTLGKRSRAARRPTTGSARPVTMSAGVSANAALLLPMVRRAIVTGRGPLALVLWLRDKAGTWPIRNPNERLIKAFTEELLLLLVEAKVLLPDTPEATSGS